jgi:hypothetical protein
MSLAPARRPGTGWDLHERDPKQGVEEQPRGIRR